MQGYWLIEILQIEQPHAKYKLYFKEPTGSRTLPTF